MKKFGLFVLLALTLSCSGTKKTSQDPQVITEIRQLDTLVVSSDPEYEEIPDEPRSEIPNTLPVYNESHRRVVDIVHTSLDLSFDWERKSVMGVAEIILKPYFYPIHEFVLDAKGFDIHSIQRKDNN